MLCLSHLEVFHVLEALGDAVEAVALQMQLRQLGQEGQAAVLDVTDTVVGQAQPTKQQHNPEHQ